MSQTSIKVALYAALDAAAGGLACSKPNAAFTPPGPQTAYYVAAVNFAQPENGEQGRGRDREVGYLEAVAKFPLGKGEGPAQAWCDAVKAAIPQSREVMTADSVSVIVDRPPEIRPGYRDAARWAQPIRVRFFANL